MDDIVKKMLEEMDDINFHSDTRYCDFDECKKEMGEIIKGWMWKEDIHSILWRAYVMLNQIQKPTDEDIKLIKVLEGWLEDKSILDYK